MEIQPRLDRRLAVLAILVAATYSEAAESWTEDFSTGVGRFSTVISNGNSTFDHNVGNENLDCHFVREPHFDRRLAILSKTYSETDSFEFTVEWSPIQGSLGAFPHIGFFDAATGARSIVLQLTDNRYQLNVAGTTPFSVENTGTDWQFGATYRLHLDFDRLTNSITFTTWILNGGDFDLQGVGSWQLPTTSFSFDSIGVGNLNEENPGPTLDATVDSFSFLGPDPIPAVSTWGMLLMTLLMLAAGTIVLSQRRIKAAC